MLKRPKVITKNYCVAFIIFVFIILFKFSSSALMVGLLGSCLGMVVLHTVGMKGKFWILFLFLWGMIFSYMVGMVGIGHVRHVLHGHNGLVLGNDGL